MALLSHHVAFYAKRIGYESLKENASFVALLKACAKKKDLHRGIQLHATIVKKGTS